MTAIARRAASLLWKVLSSAADPSSTSTAAQIYARTVADVLQLFALDGDGIVYQVTPFLGVSNMSYYALDDFLTSTASVAAVASGGTVVFTTSEQSAPGIATSTITLTAGSRATINPSNAPVSTLVMGGGSPFYFEGRSRTPTVQDATDKWVDRMGTGDVTNSADSSDGIYFESDRSTYGDNNVRLCSANGGTRTKTSMGVAPTANTFERWKWICNGAATSIQGYLNDVANGSPVTANIATANGTGAWWSQVVRSAGTNTRTVDRDYFEIYQLYNTPR